MAVNEVDKAGVDAYKVETVGEMEGVNGLSERYNAVGDLGKFGNLHSGLKPRHVSVGLSKPLSSSTGRPLYVYLRHDHPLTIGASLSRLEVSSGQACSLEPEQRWQTGDHSVSGSASHSSESCHTCKRTIRLSVRCC